MPNVIDGILKLCWLTMFFSLRKLATIKLKRCDCICDISFQPLRLPSSENILCFAEMIVQLNRDDLAPTTSYRGVNKTVPTPARSPELW